MAAAPAPTSAGVLGMARTTGVPGASAASMRASVTPAAMDSTRPTSRSARSRQTASTWSGLTATTTPSAATGSALRPTPG